jgi:hypothetical protein
MTDDLVPRSGGASLPTLLQTVVGRARQYVAAEPEDRERFADPAAAAAADAMRAQRAPASPDVIAEWLLTLDASVAPALTPQQTKARIGAVLRVLGSLPAFCWTDATLAAAAKAFRFFPTVAELDELLAPLVAEHEATIIVLTSGAKRHKERAPARESTEPYEPVASAEAPPSREQIAALGLPPDWKPPEAPAETPAATTEPPPRRLHLVSIKDEPDAA